MLEDGTVLLSGHFEDGHSPIYRLSPKGFEPVTRLPGWVGLLEPAPGGAASALHSGRVSRITPSGQVDTVELQGERDRYQFREMLDGDRALFLDSSGSALFCYSFDRGEWVRLAEAIHDPSGLRTGRAPDLSETDPPGIGREEDRVRVGRVWLPRRSGS
ncbi:MAG: hypothetical protein HY319_03020 [Armatimonadetes bacterium]|nr:hypothetical protein [Armatimonadota bacterium]